MTATPAVEAVSFDLFGTLVSVDPPPDPAGAVADELDSRGVAVPADWEAAYRESHVDAPDGAEVPLPVHVRAALASRGVEVPGEANAADPVRDAVTAAFDPAVETRPGAARAVDAAGERGSVAVLSNCSVPGVAPLAITRSAVDATALDAVVTSVDCGWRKPDARAFEAVAREVGVPVANFLHVGDDRRTDGGASAAGAAAVFVDDVPLSDLPAHLEGNG